MRGETSPEKTQSLYTARLKRTHRPHFMYVCVWKRARVWLKFFKCTFCVCMWTSIVWNDCQMCCSGNEQYCESDMQTVRTDQSTCLIGAKPQEQVCLLYCVTLQPDHWLILFVCLFVYTIILMRFLTCESKAADEKWICDTRCCVWMRMFPSAVFVWLIHKVNMKSKSTIFT